MRKSLNYMLFMLMCFLVFIIGTLHMNSNNGSRIERVLRRVDVRLMWTNASMWLHEPAPRSVVVEQPSGVVLCVVSSDEGRTERLVRVLGSMFSPFNVSVRLVIAGGNNATLRAWRHGNGMATRNVSSAWVGNRSSCFVVMDDTVDPGPYFVMWFWRMCADRNDGVDLISGDAEGSGLAPVYSLWKRFMRSDHHHEGNLTARMLAFYNKSVCYPPALDEGVIVRADYQPMAEREHPPRLARVWREAFVSEAVGC